MEYNKSKLQIRQANESLFWYLFHNTSHGVTGFRAAWSTPKIETLKILSFIKMSILQEKYKKKCEFHFVTSHGVLLQTHIVYASGTTDSCLDICDKP